MRTGVRGEWLRIARRVSWVEPGLLVALSLCVVLAGVDQAAPRWVIATGALLGIGGLLLAGVTERGPGTVALRGAVVGAMAVAYVASGAIGATTAIAVAIGAAAGYGALAPDPWGRAMALAVGAGVGAAELTRGLAIAAAASEAIAVLGIGLAAATVVHHHHKIQIEQSRAVAEAQERAGHTKAVLEALPNPTVVVSVDGRLMNANQGWYTFSAEHRHQSVVGSTIVELCEHLLGAGSPAAEITINGIREVLEQRAPVFDAELSFCHDPAQRCYQLTATPLGFSTHLGALVSCIDVTAARQNDTMIRALRHDGLTGLPNRLAFFERLREAARAGRRTGEAFAVLFVDLDRFKEVNDTYGHDVGDQFLIAVADRLRRAIRPSDLLARLAGDEFVVLCEGIDDADSATAVADRLVAALARPVQVSGRELLVTASVGVATSEEWDGEDAEALVRRADKAMYRAKRAGRNQRAMHVGSANVIDLARHRAH